MGSRRHLTREETPEKYRDKPRFSWSQIGQFNQCKWSYYLGRYLKVDDRDNIFSKMGSIVHDILDDYRNDKIKEEEMFGIFKTNFNETIASGFRFDFDEERNEKMQSKYYQDIKHYFKHYYNDEGISEEELEYRYWTDIKKRPFSGFVDRKFKQDKKYFIIDYKTSTMYSESAKQEGRGQLFLYAKGLVDSGIKIKDIRVAWDFLKYAKITYRLPKKYKVTIQNDEMYDELFGYGLVKSKRSKTFTVDNWEDKEFIAERYILGTRMSATLRKMLKNEHYEQEDIDKIVSQTIKSNDFTHIPKNIINKYEIKMLKAYVEVDFNKESIKEVESEIFASIEEIEENVKFMDTLSEDEKYKAWEREDIQENESFFCSKLCGVNHECKYFKQYMDDKELFVDDDYKTDYDDLRGDDEEILIDDDIDFDIELDDEIELDDNVGSNVKPKSEVKSKDGGKKKNTNIIDDDIDFDIDILDELDDMDFDIEI